MTRPRWSLNRYTPGASGISPGAGLYRCGSATHVSVVAGWGFHGHPERRRGLRLLANPALRRNASYLKLANVTDSATSPEAGQLPVDYFQEPLKYFARMRAKAPVTAVRMPEGNRAWMITRYAEVRAALADPRLAKDWAGKLRPADFQPDPVTGYLSAHLLSLDPPDHTRLRRLVVKAFTARRIAALRPRIEEITAALLDAMSDRSAEGEESVDLIE